ncbi:hypothetical protein JQK62_23770, partial [Leptospira santarosai]|nr:hypothetical protein [Leptospira santarosai]
EIWRGFVWIGQLLLYRATLRVIGTTNQLFPNYDGRTGLIKWLHFDFGATSVLFGATFGI